jgi:hypothetical protein
VLFPNPPLINVRVSLMLLPENKGLAEVTAKSKSWGPGSVNSTKKAVKEITGSVDTFFNVISTVGPPGVNGCKGPVTETTSIS